MKIFDSCLKSQIKALEDASVELRKKLGAARHEAEDLRAELNMINIERVLSEIITLEMRGGNPNLDMLSGYEHHSLPRKIMEYMQRVRDRQNNDEAIIKGLTQDIENLTEYSAQLSGHYRMYRSCTSVHSVNPFRQKWDGEWVTTYSSNLYSVHRVSCNG